MRAPLGLLVLITLLFFKESESSEKQDRGKGADKASLKKRRGRPPLTTQVSNDPSDQQALDVAAMYHGLGQGLSTKSVNMLDRREKFLNSKERFKFPNTFRTGADLQPNRPNQGVHIHEIVEGQELPQHHTASSDTSSPESEYENLIADTNALSIAPVNAPRQSFHSASSAFGPLPPDWGTPGMARTLEIRKNRKKSVEPAVGEIARGGFGPAPSTTPSETWGPHHVSNFGVPDPSTHGAWPQSAWPQAASPHHEQQQQTSLEPHLQYWRSQQQQIFNEMSQQAWLIYQQQQQQQQHYHQQAILQHQQYLASLNQQHPVVHQQEQINQNQHNEQTFNFNLPDSEEPRTQGGSSNPYFWGSG